LRFPQGKKAQFVTVTGIKHKTLAGMESSIPASVFNDRDWI
jgi:hypothetical protein